METNTISGNVKMATILSYFTLIGWLVSFFVICKNNKTCFSSYHFRQSLLLHLVMNITNVVLTLASTISSTTTLVFSSWLVVASYLIFMVLGAISANNEQQKDLPIIGGIARTIFS